MSTGEPTFVRRQLGVRLRRLREEADPHKTVDDVVTAGIVSRATLWRLEEGRNASSWMTVKTLCEFYDADDATTEALIRLSKASKGRGWAEEYDDVVPQTLQLYLGCELAASQISIWNPEVVPGALQDPDYAQSIFMGEGKAGTEVGRLLEARLERQERFWAHRPEGAILCAIVNEAALAREVGSRVTMGRQLDHMRQIGEWDNVDIRILRWAAGAHPAIYGGYTIFQFHDEEDPTVIYTENYTGGRYLEETKDVRRMLGIHGKLYDLSVPIKEYA